MNNSIGHIFKPVIDTFKRLNLIIFIVTIVGGLIFAVITLTNILQQPTSDSKKASSTSETLDQATVNRLNKLKPSSENLSTQSLPSGRLNPFTE